MCWAFATCGFGAQTLESRTSPVSYIFGDFKNLPDIPASYDPKLVQFPKATVAMIAADIGKGNSWSVYGSNGRTHLEALNLATIPFWIYAEYRDIKPKLTCQYVLIDGLVPASYKSIPEAGKIAVGEDEANAAVLKDCGKGFELVSREVYGSIFDAPFRSAYLTGEKRVVGAEIAKGLAHDYVEKLLNAFGGRAQLQKKLNEADKRPNPTQSFSDVPKLLKSELVAAGIHG